VKTTRREIIGLAAGAAAMQALPLLARTSDEDWARDIIWLPANGKNHHMVTYRHHPRDAAYLKTLTFQMAFSVGRADNLQYDFFYGNPWLNTDEFNGLAPFYSTRDSTQAQNSVNVLSGGNSNATRNSSIFIVGWGESKVYMARTTKGMVALVPHDWRYAARIANVSTETPPDLAGLVSQALLRLPTRGGPSETVAYMNGDIAEHFKRQTGRADEFRKIRIRIANEIRNDEAIV
jgi:hypothetical protein